MSAALYTKTQHESAQEELIGAFEGFISRHGNQYADHGIYLIDRKSNDFEIAVLKALDLPFEHLKKKKKDSVDFVPITKAHQKIRSSGKSLVNDMVFRQCSLIRSLSVLNSVHKAWVTAVYLSGDSDKILKMMFDIASKMFKVRKGTENKIVLLVQYAVHQSIANALDRKMYTDKEIAQALKISPVAYNNNWKPKLIMLFNILTDIDNSILDIVCHELCYTQYKPSMKSFKSP